MKLETIYGDRSKRHHAIMLMSEQMLHEKYPWVADVVFNETMTKKEFRESNVPDESCLVGTKPDGKEHRFVIGNEQGQILPKFLMAKFRMIESGVVWGKPLTIEVDREQRDRLYVLVREAQLRGIASFAVTDAPNSKDKKRKATESAKPKKKRTETQP